MSDFGKFVMNAERQFQEGRAEAALACLDDALAAAESDFKRSYVQGERAWIFQCLGRFEEAGQALREGIHFAGLCSWREHQENYERNLAKLYCHLGRFSESEVHFQYLLQALQERGAELVRIRESQDYGMSLVEQGRYEAALRVFEQVRTFWTVQQNPREQALSRMQLAQVYSYLGMSAQGKSEMHAAEQMLGAEEFAELRPYYHLLNARFEMIQGQMASAFRLFEEAAAGFERIQDVNGRVEVMLSLSGPLLELNLIREAQQLLDQMGDWEDLARYPALQHSVRLRRLALASFSGRDIAQDIDLVRKENEGIGRAEDWVLFWMHMSLAARYLGQNAQMQAFLKKARRVAEQIHDGLNEEHRQSFLRRPDMARLWRLTEAPSSGSAKVKALRQLDSEGPAEAGIFAPPKR